MHDRYSEEAKKIFENSMEASYLKKKEVPGKNK